MEIALTKEMETFIAEKVRSGRYADPGDVLREALQALQQREEFESPELEAALLAGVRSPHRSYGPEVLEHVRQTAKTMR